VELSREFEATELGFIYAAERRCRRRKQRGGRNLAWRIVAEELKRGGNALPWEEVGEGWLERNNRIAASESFARAR
jgi:hypothetical protein